MFAYHAQNPQPSPQQQKIPKYSNKADFKLLQITVPSECILFLGLLLRGKKLRGNNKCRTEAKPKEMVSISISKLYLVCQLHDIHVHIPVCVYVHVYICDSG